MANQDLEFRYRVRGDQAVVSSLNRIAARLGSLERRMNSVNRSNRAAGSGFTFLATGIGRAAGAMGRVVGLTARVGTGLARTAISANRLAVAGGAIATVLGIKVAKSAADAGQGVEALKLALESATGSAAKASQELEFIQKLADDLGVSVESIGQPFADMANAVVAAGGDLELARANFLGIVQAGQALGRTGDQVERALVAVSQVASKGRVSLEEISGQLSENLPGALGLAAEAMGMTTGEFVKLVSAGNLEALPFLEKFGVALQGRFAGTAAKAADDFQSSGARIRNAIRRLKLAIAESGVADAMKDLFDAIAKAIDGFARTGAKDFGAILAKRIQRLTAFINGNAKKLSAGFVLLARGPQAYMQALAELNDDGMKSGFEGIGVGEFTTLKFANAFADSQRFSSFAAALLKTKRIAGNLFEAFGNGARGALKAVTDFIQGFFRQNALNSFSDGLEAVSAKLKALSQRFREYADTGVFAAYGARVRAIYDQVASAISLALNEPREAARRTLAFVIGLIPKPIRQVAYGIAEAFKAVFNVLRAMAPVLDPITIRMGTLGRAIQAAFQASTSGEEGLAAPFLAFARVLNGGVASGAVDKFARSIGNGLENIFQFIEKVIFALKLLFNPSAANDAQLVASFGEAGQAMIDVREVLFVVIDTLKEGYRAVKGFWKEWGPAIKDAYDALIRFLDKFAPILGVKNGKQVLLLLIIFQLIGGFKILFGILSLIGKGLAFAGLIGLLVTVLGIITGLSSGALTFSQALSQLGRLGTGQILQRIFGLPYVILQLLIGTLKFGISIIRSFFQIGIGGAQALFQVIRQGSLQPLIDAFKQLGNAIRASLGRGLFGSFLRGARAAMSGAIAVFRTGGSLLINLVSRSVGFIFRFIVQRIGQALIIPAITAIGSALTAIGGLIAAAFAAAPVATVALITALIALVFALAYKFRDQIEGFFKGIGDFIYGILESLFGTRIANIITSAFNFITAPIRGIWNAIMDTIDSILTNGFSATLSKIGEKFRSLGRKVRNFFSWDSSGEDSGSNAPGYASGGPIRGKGGPRSDSILAWLSNGEYVINAAAARMFRPLLDAINYGGSRAKSLMGMKMGMPAFANGGTVMMPRLRPVGAGDAAGAGGASMRQFNAYFNGDRFMGGIPLYTDASEADLQAAARRHNRGRVRGAPGSMR